jgi:hypothetical protein
MENNNDFEKALELNERIHESVVAQDHSPERAVELPTDEVNIEAAVKTFTHGPITDSVTVSTNVEINEKLNDLMTEIDPFASEDENEVVACACSDCVESSTDTDLELIVADMSERLASLEARVAAYNAKASHKI